MRVYIGATRQNDGKTITSLGLIAAFKKRIEKVGYIKPVGQRYVEFDGNKIDEDSLLVKKVFDTCGQLRDMSPIAIPRHFTENYIDNPNRESLVQSVKDSFGRINEISDMVVVEGTGHAGVGSVFDMSNGDVAKLLGCRAIIVSSGGVGRPIDEIMLNKAIFDTRGVEILGAIINKVDEAKFDKVKSYVTKGLARHGIETLGVMPYKPMLSSPTVAQLLDDIKGELLCGADYMHGVVGRMVIGAMPPSQALDYLSRDTLLITPGTRDDLLLAAMSSCILDTPDNLCIAGMILTGGTPPKPNILELLERTRIPVIMVMDDTFSVASKIAKLIVKIRPDDSEKILAAEELVESYVDVDRILDKLKSA